MQGYEVLAEADSTFALTVVEDWKGAVFGTIPVSLLAFPLLAIVRKKTRPLERIQAARLVVAIMMRGVPVLDLQVSRRWTGLPETSARRCGSRKTARCVERENAVIVSKTLHSGWC